MVCTLWAWSTCPSTTNTSSPAHDDNKKNAHPRITVNLFITFSICFYIRLYICPGFGQRTVQTTDVFASCGGIKRLSATTTAYFFRQFAHNSCCIPVALLHQGIRNDYGKARLSTCIGSQNEKKVIDIAF